jgi:hypothetical protein
MNLKIIPEKELENYDGQLVAEIDEPNPTEKRFIVFCFEGENNENANTTN